MKVDKGEKEVKKGSWDFSTRSRVLLHFLRRTAQLLRVPLPALSPPPTSNTTTALVNMSLTLHTTLGDLKVELYPAQTPKTCENFLALAAAGTYDGTLFHRNLAGFMVQGGDPTNTGKGGTSIYGGEKFQDEIRSSLKVGTSAAMRGQRGCRADRLGVCSSRSLAVQHARRPGHGLISAEHLPFPILPHLRSPSPPRRQAYHLWPTHRWR